MTATPALTAAVQVFRDLGWDGASPEQAAELPLGTPEQRKIALAGLRSGEWAEFGSLGENSWGAIWRVDVDPGLLGLFAVRIGVDARRAAAVLPRPRQVPDEVVTEVLAQRGPRFAEQFIARACVAGRRIWTHDTTAYAGAAVRLLHRFELPVPANLDYLKDWSVYVNGALTDGKRAELMPRDRGWIDADVLAPRYGEHARAAVAIGVPATGPFAVTLPPAVQRGWIERAEAVELALAALDSAQRPGDRKAWAEVLMDGLGIGADEIVARASILLPVLAHGDGPVIEAFAPALIAGADDDTVLELLGTALFAGAAKTRRMLLLAAAKRPAPPRDPGVSETITALTTDPSAGVAKAAAALAAAWAIEVTAPPVESEPVRGLWQPTPPVWTLPRVDLGEATADRVAEALRVVSAQGDAVDTLDGERLLALTVELAHHDPAAARSVLSGLGSRTDWWLSGLAAWARGRTSPYLEIAERVLVAEPLPARNTGIADRLGTVPVLLSAPSWDDLRIDPADLITRLGRYLDARVPAVESDLLLAMLRIDPARVTPALRAEFGTLAVPVHRQDGSPMPHTAGAAVLAYLDDPMPEPGFAVERERWWRAGLPTVPTSLADFPARFGHRLGRETFPGRTGPDTGVGHGAEKSPFPAVRRRDPLDPATAINLIGAARVTPYARLIPESMRALDLAWQRGLLRPGVADLRYLDWVLGSPSHLASMATACRDLAEQGLLSVVWPVLDGLIADAASKTRIPAGTAELAETVRDLLPEVRVGADDPAALDLPGLRALATRSGSSRAVTIAQAVVADLPAAPTVAPVPAPAAVTPPDAATIWPSTAGTRPAVVDGATISADWADPTDKSKLVAVDLDLDGTRYRVVKGWFYDLEHEGQCAAVPWQDGRPQVRGQNVWLRWDGEGLVVEAERDWRAGKSGPLSSGPRGPLTTSMVAVLLASACHDSPDAVYSIRSILSAGLVGAESVRIAMPTLLAQPVISPSRMVRLLTDDPALLPVLWPVLTESVRFAAATEGAPPRWLNTVLDVALSHAELLRWAAAEGRIPADDARWDGLADLAERGGSSAAIRKARELRDALGL